MLGGAWYSYELWVWGLRYGSGFKVRLAVKDSGLRALDSVLRAFSLKFRASGE